MSSIKYSDLYDIIVVGGGHAGCEAARAAAILGSRTLLLSMNLHTIAFMSCNPSIGGIAKGQIVREIDALGGYTGIIADKTMIQFRMLNRSKGPAMWSPRSQNDKYQFSYQWKLALENTPNLDLREDTVSEIVLEHDKIKGVKTKLGAFITAKAIILTNGTFLNGKIHIGEINFEGGRLGEGASKGLSENLKSMGFTYQRLKTGTPVRIDSRSIDFSKLEEQKGDEKIGGFSFLPISHSLQQKSCWIAYTNRTVHDILRTGFDKSPMFQGRIEGIGPRYCPSIEDKIERFSGKDFHQLFLEPESETGIEYYLNGFSSSLPEEIQVKALHHIPGFEKAHILKPGYAIEYDYFPPTQLYASLETKLISNLYFAGQINGTTGYEEAACQGLIAGINAHRKIHDSDPIVLHRDSSYIGVLIDDLITKGVDEPYRMFTSRAEHRILLRQDNADLRLTPVGFEIGLIPENRYFQIIDKNNRIDSFSCFLKNNSVKPEEINPFLEKIESSTLNQKIIISKLLLRPEVSLYDLMLHLPTITNYIKEKKLSESIMEQVEILIKYENYIIKEKELAERINNLEKIKLNPEFDYNSISSLSIEARQKLSRIKPMTLGQASRISGVSPSDISVLLVLLGR
ncbi:MAG TPA: tRNA uridine-5-carboxymethylaminomethyl(34) synthesis enzyme MnmG [Bacteroidales bacterium]|nr:tRNA uridine-5-carboxymethylaminomethyl(34) synthesis enzyme MnmG [Bacteroidales bacterium]